MYRAYAVNIFSETYYVSILAPPSSRFGLSVADAERDERVHVVGEIVPILAVRVHHLVRGVVAAVVSRVVVSISALPSQVQEIILRRIHVTQDVNKILRRRGSEDASRQERAESRAHCSDPER